MDLTTEECEELYLQYIGKEPSKQNFVDDICINCNECKHNFSNNVRINCGIETEGCINYGEENCKRVRPKQNTVLSLIDLRNLNLDCDIFSSTFEMYQQTMGNNIYQSRVRKSILCACIYIAFMKKETDYDKKYFLSYFGISERDCSLGYKRVKLSVPDSRII